VFTTIIEQLETYLCIVWVPRFLNSDVATTCRADIMSAAETVSAGDGTTGVLWVQRPDVFELGSSSLTLEDIMSDPQLDLLLMEMIEADFFDMGLARSRRLKAADEKHVLMFWRTLNHFTKTNSVATVRQAETARAAVQIFALHLQNDPHLCKLRR
jgi:hypothetical protein